jgi:glycosyltransferase involved in cell wall biosynthesis
MNKIKVCHIITKLELGGAQQNTIYTVGHLDKEKYIPILVAGCGGILDSKAVRLPGVNVYFHRFLVRPIHPFYDFLAFLQLWWLLMKEKPDVVHTHSSKAGIVGRWAAFAAGVPVIVHTLHGFGFHDYQHFLIKYLYVFLERFCAFFSDKLIAVAAEDIAKGLQYGIGDKELYMVIRSGISFDRYANCSVNKETKRNELGIGKNEFLITTIGPFKPQKNLKDFITVAQKVKESGKSCKFVVVGDGEQRPDLERMIRERSLDNDITLVGWRSDVNEILSITDIFVMTSLWEGLPRSILEAMLSGKPVVANAVDGVKEIVKHGETGYTVQPFDIASMVRYNVELLESPDKRTAMGVSGRKSIGRQFDINFMVQQQDDLYLHCHTAKKQ